MGQPQLDNPSAPALDAGGQRLTVFNPKEPQSSYTNALAAMEAARAKSATGLHDVSIDGAPQHDKYANKTNEEVLKTLPKEDADFAKQALQDIPHGKIMEGLHPGEIAVGNWQPSQEEKAILARFDEQMVAKGQTDGRCKLPDGSVVEVHLVPRKGTATGAIPTNGKKDNSDDPEVDVDDVTNSTGRKGKSQKQLIVVAPDTLSGGLEQA